MNEWWNALSYLQQVMFVIGSATLLFMIVQIVMMLIGLGDHDVSTDTDLSGLGDTDVSVETDVADFDADADASCDGGEVCTHSEGMEHFHAFGFRLLSLRCLITLFCFGAWTVFIFAEFLAWYYSCLIGLAVGFAAAVGMALIMGKLMQLQRDGTIKMKNCLGMEGEVYLTIPAKGEGKGKINVTVQERFAEFDAVTEDEDAINTGEKIKVLKVDGDTLTVERVRDRNRQAKEAKAEK